MDSTPSICLQDCTPLLLFFGVYQIRTTKSALKILLFEKQLKKFAYLVEKNEVE